MATVLRSDLFTIIPALKARLMVRLWWPSERVLIVDPRRIKHHPQGDQYICLWLADQGHPDMPVWQGAGRFDARMTVRLAVTLRSRYAVDEATSSEKWLTDHNAGLGHLLWAGKIVDALVGFVPTDTADGSGNWYTIAPIEPAPVGMPSQEVTRDPEWGESVIGFALTHQMNLDQTQG